MTSSTALSNKLPPNTSSISDNEKLEPKQGSSSLVSITSISLPTKLETSTTIEQLAKMVSKSPGELNKKWAKKYRELFENSSVLAITISLDEKMQLKSLLSNEIKKLLETGYKTYYTGYF